MKPWPSHPLIYEINTWVWLRELGQKYQQGADARDGSRSRMGVDRGAGIRRHLVDGGMATQPGRNPGSPCTGRGWSTTSSERFGFAAQDNVGSPYCVRRYVVDEQLGGPPGLRRRQARATPTRLAPHSRLRSQPHGARPSLGRNAPRVLRSRQRRRCAQRPGVVHRSVGNGVCLRSRPVLFRPGPTCCNSTPWHPGCDQQRSTPSRRSPRNATACAATWRC